MEYEDVTALLLRGEEKAPVVWNDAMYRRALANLDRKLITRLHQLHDGVEAAAMQLDDYVTEVDPDAPDELHRILAVLNGVL